MKEISRFRGMSGEVVGNFLSIFTLFSALPILVVFFLLGLAASTLRGNAEFIVAPVMMAVYVMIVGRFALPARHGDLDSGFFLSAHVGDGDLGALLRFVGRYLVLTLAWVVPIALLMWLLMDRETLFFGFLGMFNPLSAMEMGAVGLLLVAVTLASVLMPTLCFIVATYADSLSESLSPETWGWLFSERGADLPAFYAGLIGGMIVFFGVSLIPLAVISFLAFKISVQAGVAVSGFLYLLFVAASPILLGRMCGAFVAGEAALEEETHDSVLPEAVRSSLHPPFATPVVEEPVVIEKKPTLDEIIARVRALPADALTGEIDRLGASLAARPRDPHAAAELALLHKKAGDREGALKAAANAIHQAVRDGFAEFGVLLFRAFTKERAALGLSAQALEMVGNVLLKQEAFLEAGWCFHASGAASGGDVLAAQKKLLHTASTAEEAGKSTDAVALYDFFTKKYADSPLAQFARQGVERVRQGKP